MKIATINKNTPIKKCPPIKMALRLRNSTEAIDNIDPAKPEIPINYVFYVILNPFVSLSWILSNI
jgi:hypothetical protein